MSQTNVREIPATDGEGLKSFVALERRWVGTNPQYVSQIDADVIKGLSGRSAFFSEMEHVLFTTSNGGRDVARCAALINRRYQKATNVKRGFIGWFNALPGEDTAVRAIRGTGLAHALAVALYRRYEDRGFKEAFYYPVNEENSRSRKFAESMGGTGRVLAHCYDKRLG